VVVDQREELVQFEFVLEHPEEQLEFFEGHGDFEDVARVLLAVALELVQVAALHEGVVQDLLHEGQVFHFEQIL